MCVNCHKAGGDAEGSKLILRDPTKVEGRCDRNRSRGAGGIPVKIEGRGIERHGGGIRRLQVI